MNLTSRHIGNYILQQMIGEGGMGQAYLAEHPLIGHRVAVKVLHPECAANPDTVHRFFQEAKAVNDIRHENIVDIVDYGMLEGEPPIVYLMMELLEGESLAKRIERGRFTTAEIVHIFTQCCSALSASHRKGIIHRDLKPDNIYLVRRGDDASFVKVLDFGIAKLIGPSTTESGKTRQGVVLGTPAYMSPEQCAGLGDIDGRSDVYSLGIVMYECLTGRIPFGGGVSEIVTAHLARPPQPPSKLVQSIDPTLEAVVMRSMEKDPSHRFQTMDEMAEALAAGTRTPARAPAARTRRRAVALAAGTAGVIAGALALALGLRTGPTTTDDRVAVATATHLPVDAAASPAEARIPARAPAPAPAPAPAVAIVIDAAAPAPDAPAPDAPVNDLRAATATRPQPPASAATGPKPPATTTRPPATRPATTATGPKPPATTTRPPATATRAPVTPAARNLDEARAAMEQRKYTVALDKAETVLRTAPGNEDALRIAVLAACKLRDARRAAEYLRRTRADLRAMARQVCATNGVTLP
jgi:serine/threonine-protein kinase